MFEGFEFNQHTMIIIWASIIAISLLIEYFTNELVTIWCAGSGVVSLLLAGFGVGVEWQVITFFAISLPLVLFVRGIIKKKMDFPTVATNIVDTYTGKQMKLTKQVSEGRGEIKINDTFWRVEVENAEGAEVGTLVELIEMKGNVFKAKLVETK